MIIQIKHRLICFTVSFLITIIAIMFGSALSAHAAEVDRVFSYVDNTFRKNPEVVKDYNDFIFMELRDGNVAIIGYFGHDKNVVFPSKIDGKKVEAVFGNYIRYYIGQELDYSGIKEVTISEGIEYVGMFSCFKPVKADSIPDNIFSYYDWVELNDYSFDDHLPFIYEYEENGETVSFKYAYTSLKKVTLPASLKEIGSLSFVGLELTTIGTKESIEEEKVQFPSNTEYIGAGTFDLCLKIKNVVIPEKIDTIEKNLFADCNKLENVVLPAGVEEIKAYAFNGCSSLEYIDLPQKLSSIGDFGFSTSGLVKVELPQRVTELGESCFSLCSSLEELIVNSKDADIDRVFGDSANAVTTKIGCRSYSKALSFAKINGLDYELINGDTIDQDYDYYDSSSVADNEDHNAYAEAETTAEEVYEDSRIPETASETTSESAASSESSKDKTDSESSLIQSEESSREESSDQEKSVISENEDNVKSSSGTIVIIILLSVLIVLVIGGFVVYFLVIKKRQQ